MEQFWLDFMQSLAILLLGVSIIIGTFGNIKKEKKK